MGKNSANESAKAAKQRVLERYGHVPSAQTFSAPTPDADRPVGTELGKTGFSKAAERAAKKQSAQELAQEAKALAAAYFDSLPDYEDGTGAPKFVMWARVGGEVVTKQFWRWVDRAEFKDMAGMFDDMHVLRVGGNPFPVKSSGGFVSVSYTGFGNVPQTMEVARDTAISVAAQYNASSIANNASAKRTPQRDWNDEYTGKNGKTYKGSYFSGGIGGTTDVTPRRSKTSQPPPFVQVRDWEQDGKAADSDDGQVVRKLANRTIVPKRA